MGVLDRLFPVCWGVFGIFYTVTYLLALRWWLATLVIIAIGVIWGSIIYSNNKPETETKTETKTEKEEE